MSNRERLIGAMASVKPDVRKRMDAAIAAILALAWRYRGEDFSFEAHEDIDAEVNKILAAMSDGNLADAEARAKRLLEDLELEEYEDEAIEYAEREIDGQDALHRFDMHAWHLKDLLAGWLIVAGVAGLTKQQTMLNLYAYLGNPMASKDWREAGLSAPHWGTGYAGNVLNGITVIGQNLINTAQLYGNMLWYGAQGAEGYRVFRQSSYDCPICDAICAKIWPLNNIVVPVHSRCVCGIEPFYGDKNEVYHEPNSLTAEEKQRAKSLEREAKKLFAGKTYENVLKIEVSGGSIHEYINQPYFNRAIKNESVMHIDRIITEAKYLGINTAYVKDGVKYSHIYQTKLMGRRGWLVVREYEDGRILLHSCSDQPRIATKLKKRKDLE